MMNKNGENIWDDWVGDSSDDETEKETKPMKEELGKESSSNEQTMESTLPQQVVGIVVVDISLPQQDYQSTSTSATSVTNHPKATKSLKMCSLPRQKSAEGMHV